MKWFDENSYVQTLPNDLAKSFVDSGWSEFLKYRSRFGSLVGDESLTYADIRLFRSTGSDRQKRHLGMAFGYDPTKSEFADKRRISENSPLGIIGVGDGETKDFNAKVFPIAQHEDVDVFVDGSRLNDSRFEVIHRSGLFRFKTAPSDGAVITVNYKMDKTAPEPPTYLVFFTFDNVNLSRLVGDDTPIIIDDGDGTTKVFRTPTKPIKQGSMELYLNGRLLEDDEYSIDLTTGEITFIEAPELGAEITARYVTILSGSTLSILGDGDGSETEFFTENSPIATTSVKVYNNGVLQNEESYTVDHEEGKITFITPPALGNEITASYIDLTGGAPSGVTQLENDINALENFDPYDPSSLMDAVYSSLDYKVPSMPTVVDFTTERTFGRGWQRDSFVYRWGNINKDRCMMFLRPDPSADAQTALYAPLYFGRLHTKGRAPRQNMIIAGGASTGKEIKYKADMKLGGLVVDYGRNTSNGNQGVQLMQGLGGAYYQ